MSWVWKCQYSEHGDRLESRLLRGCDWFKQRKYIVTWSKFWYSVLSQVCYILCLLYTCAQWLVRNCCEFIFYIHFSQKILFFFEVIIISKQSIKEIWREKQLKSEDKILWFLSSLQFVWKSEPILFTSFHRFVNYFSKNTKSCRKWKTRAKLMYQFRINLDPLSFNKKSQIFYICESHPHKTLYMNGWKKLLSVPDIG